MNKKNMWAWVGGGIVVIIIIVVIMAHGSGPSATQTGQTQPSAQNSGNANQFVTVNVAAPTAAYNAATDDFTIDFPVVPPQITKSTFHSPTAGYVPVTEYRADVSPGGGENAYYTVYVYHYPASYKFASDYLTVAAQSYSDVIAAMYPGTTILSQQSIQFLGNAGLSAVINVPLQLTAGSTATSNTPDYVTIAMHGQNVYFISTYGIDQTNYNAFVNSFEFAQ